MSEEQRPGRPGGQGTWWSKPADDPWAPPPSRSTPPPADEQPYPLAPVGTADAPTQFLPPPLPGQAPEWHAGWEQRRTARGGGAGAGVLIGGLLLGLLAGGAAGGVAGYLAGQGDVSLSGDGIQLDPGDGKIDRAPDSVAGIAARVLPAVVNVDVTGEDEGTGSGFVLDERGYILTNSHVVAGNVRSIEVTFSDRQKTKATVVGSSQRYDLAVLRVNGVKGLQALPLGNSDDVVVGDPVVAVGSPLGLAGTVTSGIVSALNRSVTAGDPTGDASIFNAIQTDAAINPGNSGGPLVNGRGEVIGINTAIATTGATALDTPGSIGVGFALPINVASRAATQLIETGKAVHPIIGALLDPSFTGEGAKIADEPRDGTPPLVPDGPAEKAGVKPGDVIVAFDGQPIEGPGELISTISARSPGETAELTIVRAGKRLDPIKVTLGESTDEG